MTMPPTSSRPRVATLDRGLQLATPSANGCLFSIGNQPSPLNNLLELPSPRRTPSSRPTSGSRRRSRAGFNDVVLDREGELDLWTQTINDGVYGGKVCVWLYVFTAPGRTARLEPRSRRQPDLFTYSRSTWPNNGWSEIQVPLHFPHVTLPAGARLGLAVTLEKQGTPSSSGLQFMYDHPSFDSRLEVDTHSLVPIF